MVPLNAFSPKGTDCTSIIGVADVGCESGECVVRRCLHGLVPSSDGSSCVPKESKTSHHPDYLSEFGAEDDEYVPARLYGLEHVPLERN
jgi:hypothetical protein